MQQVFIIRGKGLTYKAKLKVGIYLIQMNGGKFLAVHLLETLINK